MLAFDTECTGVDVERDHILSATLVHVVPDEYAVTYATHSSTEWIDPGVPIPPESTKIHGITDELIRQRGQAPAETLEAICLVIAAVLQEGTPLVGMNVPYDLTILDRNCRRHGVKPLGDRVAIAPVIDVWVLDKAVDPYRKGSGMRKLGAICPLYRVRLDGAHTSEGDALAVARVAWRIGRMYPKLGALTARHLHDLQVQWKLDQDTGFAAWLIKQGKDPSGVDGQWPIRAQPRPVVVPANTAGVVGELVEVPLW
jgi:DNA polymerase-3 subunit epsilon